MAAPARAKIGGKGEYAVDHAAQIDRQDDVVAFGRHIGEFLAIGRDTGVAAQDIDRPEGGFRLSLGPGPGLATPHIEHYPAHTVAARRSGRRQCIGVDIGDSDGDAALDESIDHAEAEPGSTAGDEGVFCG